MNASDNRGSKTEQLMGWKDDAGWQIDGSSVEGDHTDQSQEGYEDEMMHKESIWGARLKSHLSRFSWQILTQYEFPGHSSPHSNRRLESGENEEAEPICESPWEMDNTILIIAHSYALMEEGQKRHETGSSECLPPWGESLFPGCIWGYGFILPFSISSGDSVRSDPDVPSEMCLKWSRGWRENQKMKWMVIEISNQRGITGTLTEICLWLIGLRTHSLRQITRDSLNLQVENTQRGFKDSLPTHKCIIAILSACLKPCKEVVFLECDLRVNNRCLEGSWLL